MNKVSVKDVVHEKCVRKTFAKIGDSVDIPNLIQVQKDSYDWFIKEGLGEVLEDVSPIIDYTGNLVLEFFDYYMEEKTKYSLEEAKERDATIGANRPKNWKIWFDIFAKRNNRPEPVQQFNSFF